MLHLKYKLTTFESFLQQLAEKLNTKMVGDTLCFDPSFATGFVHWKKLSNGLEILIADFELHQETALLREGDSTDRFLLVCSEVNKKTTFKTDVAKFGVFISSTSFEQNVFLKPGTKFKELRILISQNWLAEYCNRNVIGEMLDQFLNEKATVSFLSGIDIEYRNILGELIKGLAEKKAPIFFERRVLEIIEKLFIEISLSEQEQKAKEKDISEADVKSAELTRDLITADFSEPPPTLSQLAKKVGMSEAKFKIVFKKVYGHSPYKYLLIKKMEQAYLELISTQKSISDIAYDLGYNNLASFSTAFKKHYKVTPSKVSKDI